MPLTFADGEPFALGAAPYAYHKATTSETAPRIVLSVLIGGCETSAFVDTGGVYCLCTPPLAHQIGLDPASSLGTAAIFWRRDRLRGRLYRLPITLLAAEGESLTIEVTAFVPELSSRQAWNDELPCVLGMQFCLERLRFAVDPEQELFYFGEFGAAP